MADKVQIKFYGTTSEKLNTIPVEVGNLIFVSDEKYICLDSPSGRQEYKQITILNEDSERGSFTGTVAFGFFFVKSTNILWKLERYTWTQLTEPPKEQVVYGTLQTFPAEGRVGVLYMTDNNLYRWDEVTSSYVSYNSDPLWVIEED